MSILDDLDEVWLLTYFVALHSIPKTHGDPSIAVNNAASIADASMTLLKVRFPAKKAGR